jgi:pyruvate dehydrogenase E2 component (dihydrolipoamide acetyltransferase)
MPELRVPHLSLSDEDVVLVRWHKAVGDTVTLGEPVLEVETDKASMDVEAPFAGTLTAQSCEPGDTLAPGAVIGYIATSDEAHRSSDLVESTSSATTSDAALVASPTQARGVDRRPLVAGGELRGFPRRSNQAPQPPGSSSVAAAAIDGDGFSERSLSRRRRAIARRLQEAADIPQFGVTKRISLQAAQTAVEHLRTRGEAATLTDVLVRAVAVAALELPETNAWLLEERIRTFEHVALALAVETDDGVVAPVIRNADQLDLPAIVQTRIELVERARAEQLRAHELDDATFTLTNVGPLGGEQLFPVLTPPQVSVIGVGRDSGDGATFTFVGDHRALDGATGARFLVALADALTHEL